MSGQPDLHPLFVFFAGYPITRASFKNEKCQLGHFSHARSYFFYSAHFFVWEIMASEQGKKKKCLKVALTYACESVALRHLAFA